LVSPPDDGHKSQLKHVVVNSSWNENHKGHYFTTLHLLTRNNEDANIKNFYKQYCKILTNVIKEAKRSMYNNQINNSANKIKATWNIVKAETNRLQRPSANKYQNSLDTFNNYFLSIANKITCDIRYRNSKGRKAYKSPTYYLTNLFHKPFPNIQFNNTSTNETDKIIKSLNLKKSSGYEEISTKILKISAPFITSPLNYICNKSLLSGIFPTQLKYSIIKPVYKKGDRDNVANYRPISLLTAFSKVFERIIYDRLLQHTETNNILTDEQFGFRTFSSTEKASYKLIDGILDALNNKMMVGGIFCNLQKAFDCVNHSILLTK